MTRAHSTRVLVAGEALIDIVHQGAAHEHVGGSPLNVAVGLGRLGHSAELITWIGSDERGHRILSHLERSGVRLTEGSDGAERTSTAIARIDAHGAAHYEFDIEWAPVVSESSASDVALVHVGSLGAFLDPGAEAIEALVAAAHGRAIVSFDPNIRPTLLHDHAATLERFERLAGLSTIVKLSDEDAGWLYPGRSVESILNRLASWAPSVVVITRGGDGSMLRSGDVSMAFPAATTSVIDTVGAGDSFMAGAIHRLLELDSPLRARLVKGDPLPEERLEDLGEFAARCAGITVSRSGADLPTLDEVC